jgi:hypothetical protein
MALGFWSAMAAPATVKADLCQDEPSCWSVTLSASASSVPLDIAVTLTATANQMVYDTDFSIQIWYAAENVVSYCYVGPTCSATVSSATATSTAYHAVIWYILGSEGNEVYATSSSKTVAWTNTWSVGLTASLADGTALGGASVTAGTGVTLTATTNFNLVGSGYFLWIQDLSGQIVNGTACTGQKCVTVVSRSAGAMTYRAYVGTVTPALVGSEIAHSGALSVTWTAPWTVTLKASATKVTAGTTVILTATTNQDLGSTAYELLIVNTGTKTASGRCGSGTTCTAYGPLNGAAGTYKYIAEVVTSIGYSGSIQAISVPLTITISPGAATHFKVAVGMNPWPAGSTHSVTVTALDAYGNVATGYTGMIHFTTTDASASVPAEYKFTSTDKGVHTFANTLIPGLTLKTVGSTKVTATDVSKASITGYQTVTVQ